MEKKHSKKGKHLVSGLILLLNGIAMLLLILAYTSYHVRPSFIPYIAFAGLAYPYILLSNLAFILFWLLSRPRYAILPAILVLAGWNHIGRLMQLSGTDVDENTTGKIKVLSYNLQNFLKINTSTTKYLNDFRNEDDIIRFLQTENAGIVCLQEMLHDRESKKKFAEKMAVSLNCPHYHYVNYFTTNEKILDAIATFSRYPILNKGDLAYDDKSIGIFTDLNLGRDTVRVYNLHLASIHFKQEDYEFWSEIANNREQENFTVGTGKILTKMQAAFLKRAGQSDYLAEHMENSPYPVIICGDFNDTPSSFTYNRLSRDKKDAFVMSGSGFGNTYAGEFFPAFRIDYILYEKPYRSAGFKRHKVPYSDHYPVTTYLYSD